ncbi:MAG: hypothetical protein N2749_01805 [Clostridia bacterium]|nr:hypothetical protein [Clostridia bacterium]
MNITPDTSVESIIEKYPETICVFKKYDIEVIICGQVVWDNIGELCLKNGINSEIIIQELKEIIRNS